MTRPEDNLDLHDGQGFFLTWQRHQRTMQLGASAGIAVVVLQTELTGFARYRELLWKSFCLLRQRRPAWLIVQSPSFVLAGFAVTFGRFFTRAVIVDAHNEAVRPYINDHWSVRWIARQVIRLASAVIVTNDELAELVRDFGGVPLVLPDPLPHFERADRIAMGPGMHVAVICTYAADEPIEDILAAAGTARAGLTFHFTGPTEKLSARLRSSSPPNVRFTGFLPEERYWQLLQSVDVVMDLTLMPDCLVCGAYEALAAGVPSILSDNRAGHRHFEGAAFFTSPDRRSIEIVLNNLDSALPACRSRIPAVTATYSKHWQSVAGNLTTMLQTHE